MREKKMRAMVGSVLTSNREGRQTTTARRQKDRGDHLQINIYEERKFLRKNLRIAGMGLQGAVSSIRVQGAD